MLLGACQQLHKRPFRCGLVAHLHTCCFAVADGSNAYRILVGFAAITFMRGDTHKRGCRHSQRRHSNARLIHLYPRAANRRSISARTALFGARRTCCASRRNVHHLYGSVLQADLSSDRCIRAIRQSICIAAERKTRTLSQHRQQARK